MVSNMKRRRIKAEVVQSGPVIVVHLCIHIYYDIRDIHED
jgi:hypothetical protein